MMPADPVIPAYSFHNGVARIGFFCPHCRVENRHGDTGGLIESRGSDLFYEACPFLGHGYCLLMLGRVRGWRFLPRMSAPRFSEAVKLHSTLEAAGQTVRGAL